MPAGIFVPTFPALTTVAFDQSDPRWLGISDLIAEPEGPAFISYKVARSRLNRLRFVTQDPSRTWGWQGRLCTISRSSSSVQLLMLAELWGTLPITTQSIPLFNGLRDREIAHTLLATLADFWVGHF